MSTMADPARDIRAVTLDAEMTGVRGLSIGVAGDINITTLAGTTVTVPVQAGIFPVRVKQVSTAGTTATGIFAFY